MYKCICMLSMHVAYIKKLSAICTLNLCIDSENGANWSAEEIRGSCWHWGHRICNINIDALMYGILSR